MSFTPHDNVRKWADLLALKSTWRSGLNCEPLSKDKVQLGPQALMIVQGMVVTELSSRVILSIDDVVHVSQRTVNTHACLFFFLSLKVCLGYLSFVLSV